MSVVVVQCFHCSAVLELDEGFRGGVCRCSSCGSLLQVPRGEREAGGRKPRPAAPQKNPPPAALEARVVESGTAETSEADEGSHGVEKRTPAVVDSGAALGAVVPGLEASVSSSSLRRIQQTKPIDTSEKPKKQKQAKLPPPAIHEVRRNSALLWAAFILIAVIAAIVIATMLMYLYGGGAGGR